LEKDGHQLTTLPNLGMKEDAAFRIGEVASNACEEASAAALKGFSSRRSNGCGDGTKAKNDVEELHIGEEWKWEALLCDGWK
jgi:hypothetical protein